MTKKWFVHTPNPPRIPIFYTLTKIHKPKLVGRPIISGCDGPTERICSFVDTLLQPIVQKQKSFIEDTTDFIRFIEKTKVGKDIILVSMDRATRNLSRRFTSSNQNQWTPLIPLMHSQSMSLYFHQSQCSCPPSYKPVALIIPVFALTKGWRLKCQLYKPFMVVIRPLSSRFINFCFNDPLTQTHSFF